ncbi:energy transducer TonB [Massilia sp. MB5]|uniref:energy transducer TonB n=1 Tax=unclassified Massilia TaxID=2609279 RepID=UPI00067BC600|nr:MULTISPECIES: energy transducer TonB [unclassified Massilia]UMR30551.1 energy transducer TonB [Massilia sp. MB5]
MSYSLQQPRNKSSAIAIALLHLAAFGFLLHNNTIRLPRTPPNVVDLVDTPREEPRPPEPQPEPLDNLRQPPAPVAPPLPDSITPPTEPIIHIRTTDDELPPERGTRSGAATEGAPTTRETPHTPLRVAAVVDASACAKPEYPPKALRNGDTGTVMLAFLIGVDGKVKEARIEKSSGSRELDRAAQAGLGLCRFKPGTVDGVAQESWTRMQYVWNLDE